jgi:hypothetical protein
MEIYKKLNSLTINAAAGHGKDYTMDIINELIDIKTNKLSFSEAVKEMVAKNLPERVTGKFKEKNIELLNILKDERHDIKVFGNMNMRKFLQVFMGNEILRSINPSINMLFTANKMKESLLVNPDCLFVCSDNRYANEQEFLIKFNQVSKDLREDFLNDYLLKNKTILNNFEIISIIENNLSELSKDSIDDKYASRLIKTFMSEHNKLKIEDSTKIYNFDNLMKDFNYDSLSSMSKEEGLKYGIIHVFRPLIPEGIKITFKNDQIKKEIMKYQNISDKDVNEIENRYQDYGIKFNIENIKKYSYLRADPNHPSESQLSQRKPEAFINYPEKSNETGIEKELINILIKQKKEKKIKSTKKHSL